MPTNYEITSVYDDNLFSLSEEDIKNRYITPSIEAILKSLKSENNSFTK